jgi:hypothetical protein
MSAQILNEKKQMGVNFASILLKNIDSCPVDFGIDKILYATREQLRVTFLANKLAFHQES